MKKLLYAGLVLVGTATISHAQHVRLGFRAGYTRSTVTGSGASGLGAMSNPAAGIIINVPLAAHGLFSLQPELLYARKGYRSALTAYPNRFRLDYLNLPVLAKISVGGFLVEAGPQLGYLVGARSNNPVLSLREQRSVAPYQRWEAGYIVGVGYELTNGVGLGARYNGGLTRLYWQSSPPTSARLYNAAWQVQLSYLLPRG